MPYYDYIVHLIDGNGIPVRVAAVTEEEAAERAILAAGTVAGQDVGHLVTEVEGTDF